MGLSIKWDITYKCNLMCDHCINGNYLDNSCKEIDYTEITQIIDRINNNIVIDYIHFLGGEPLTRDDFVDILLYLEEKNIKFGFNTNGLLFNEDTLKKIGHLKNFQTVIISLEGPNAEVNDAIRGKNVFKVLFDRMQLVKEYKRENPSSSFRLCVNTVVTSQNYKYIPDIIKLCEQEETSELNLLEFIEDGNGVGKKLSLDSSQFLEAVKLVAEYYSSSNSKMKIVPRFARPIAKKYAKECLGLEFPDIVHACGAGATTLFIDNQGYIYPCYLGIKSENRSEMRLCRIMLEAIEKKEA